MRCGTYKQHLSDRNQSYKRRTSSNLPSKDYTPTLPNRSSARDVRGLGVAYIYSTESVTACSEVPSSAQSKSIKSIEYGTSRQHIRVQEIWIKMLQETWLTFALPRFVPWNVSICPINGFQVGKSRFTVLVRVINNDSRNQHNLIKWVADSYHEWAKSQEF